MSASPFDDPCVKWVKSSYSYGDNNDCVEVARGSDLIGIRDSKNPHLHKLGIAPAGARGLVAEIKAGRFNR